MGHNDKKKDIRSLDGAASDGLQPSLALYLTLGAGHLSTQPRVYAGGLVQGTRQRLEDSLHPVVVVRAGEKPHMQV